MSISIHTVLKASSTAVCCLIYYRVAMGHVFDSTTRVALQANRDDEQKKIDDVKVETTRRLNQMARKINDGKKFHDDLTKEVSVC